MSIYAQVGFALLMIFFMAVILWVLFGVGRRSDKPDEMDDIDSDSDDSGGD